jgi:hypothetical protein
VFEIAVSFLYLATHPMTDSQNVLIGQITSLLLVDLENLRQAAIKRDIGKVEQIILHKEKLLNQIKMLVENKKDEGDKKES